MNERQRRMWAAAEACEIGQGGMTCVAEATGMSRTTIRAGMRELTVSPKTMSPQGARIRRRGGGRKPLVHHDEELANALDELIEPMTRGTPVSPLRWTCKSTRRLAAELTAQGHAISREGVARLLKSQGYSLQANRKTVEGKQHPDRNAQFEYINKRVRSAQRRDQPTISVDTKKKELVGSYRNCGREWRPQGAPEEVRVHDFPDKELGKVIPYGIYDMKDNNGWVSVGIDHDTADFAVESIRRWWVHMGKKRYPHARQLTITADSGGSNNYRSRAWKVGLQKLAEQTSLRIRVHHFPPGTSKWNKIEHRLFCHITNNWRARPLVTREAVVELIGNTTTTAGLKIRACLDTNSYPTGRKISDDELARVRLRSNRFHGEWNYQITPQPAD
jgi:hypothetical protein